jgi:hypothetical protein
MRCSIFVASSLPPIAPRAVASLVSVGTMMGVVRAVLFFQDGEEMALAGSGFS